MTTFPDEYIHHWGEVFTANHLHARGILFETFLLAPREILAAAKLSAPQDEGEEFRPLLPRQAQVLRRETARDVVKRIRTGLATAEDADLLEAVLLPAEAEHRGERFVESRRHVVATKKWKTHGRRAVV